MATRLPNELIDEILKHLPVSISISLAREAPKRYLLKGTTLRHGLNNVDAFQWAVQYDMKWDLLDIKRAYDRFCKAEDIKSVVAMEEIFEHAVYLSVPHDGTFYEIMKNATKGVFLDQWGLYWVVDRAVKYKHLDDVWHCLCSYGTLRCIWTRVLQNAVLDDNPHEVIADILYHHRHHQRVHESSLVQDALLTAARNDLSEVIITIYGTYRPPQPWNKSWRKLHLEAIQQASTATVVQTLLFLYLPPLDDFKEAQLLFPESRIFTLLAEEYLLFSSRTHSRLLHYP